MAARLVAMTSAYESSRGEVTPQDTFEQCLYFLKKVLEGRVEGYLVAIDDDEPSIHSRILVLTELGWHRTEKLVIQANVCWRP